MLTPVPAQAQIFNEAYPILGEYCQDDQRVPFYLDPAKTYMIEPGEPVLIQWDGGTHVMLAPSHGIRPGGLAMLYRYFAVDLPCNFSADVILGDAVTWDQDNKELVLPADIATNKGFPCGNASWHFDPLKKKVPPIDGNGRVIVATSSDTSCRTIVMPGAVTGNNTPVVH